MDNSIVLVVRTFSNWILQFQDACQNKKILPRITTLIVLKDKDSITMEIKNNVLLVDLNVNYANQIFGVNSLLNIVVNVILAMTLLIMSAKKVANQEKRE